MAVSESSARKYALDPEVRLMLEVRDDNAAAFQELLLRHQGRLVTFFSTLSATRIKRRIWPRKYLCGCIVREKSYEPGAKFATWLFTIANHVAANA